MLSEGFRRPFDDSSYDVSLSSSYTPNFSVYSKSEQILFPDYSEPNRASLRKLTDLKATDRNKANSLFDNFEPPTNLVDSFYSSAALETRRIYQFNEHEDKIPPIPRGRPLQRFSLIDLLSDVAPHDHTSTDLQNMLMSLIYNRFIPHSVLWPGTNFALSQIREWPTTFESGWCSSNQVNDGIFETQQKDTSAWTTFKNKPNIWSGTSHIPNVSSISTSNVFFNYPKGAIGRREDSVPHSNFRNVPSNPEMTDGHQLTAQVPQATSNHVTEISSWNGSDLNNDESETRINQMVAELSVSGVANRRLPKREEDIKKLQHFRNLKEKGKGGKTNIQQLPSRPVR